MRPHDGDDAVDQFAGSEVLAGTALLFGGVAFEQAFVQVAQVLALDAVPVEFVDLDNEFGQGGWLGDDGAGIGVNLQDDALAMPAIVPQQVFVGGLNRGSHRENATRSHP